MEKARKYNLLFENIISCGLGTYSGNTLTYNLLGSFYVNRDTIPPTTYTYQAITVTQLMNLSSTQYDCRVKDFLCARNVQSNVMKQRLMEEAAFNDPACGGQYCMLNSNFLVYKFLSGIRIVNVGVANGEIQYKVYPTTSNPDNYTWETNPTFLDLNQTGLYVVLVRDFSNNEEVCKVQKIVNISLLVPSTTTDLSPKTVAILETANSDTQYNCFSTGCFRITNPLTQFEKVLVNYSVNATNIGSATACAVLNCKANGYTTCAQILCQTQLCASPKTGSFTMCYGDNIYYNLVSTASVAGSTASANIKITSVQGLNTTLPSIDNTRCCTSVSKSIGAQNIIVNLIDNPTSINTLTLCSVEGVINFNPPIPNGLYVTVGFSAVTTSVGGSSFITYYCKPNGGTSYTPVFTDCNIQTQPRYPSIEAKYGDSICYKLNTTAPNIGTAACAKMCINNLTASIGINPTYGTPICSLAFKNQVASDMVVSICNQNTVNYINARAVDGFINSSPLVSTSQCIVANMGVCATKVGLGCGKFELYCKPNGGASFILDCTVISSINTPTSISALPSIVLRHGDCICYRIYSAALPPPNEYAEMSIDLSLCSVIGYGGSNPTINTNYDKTHDAAVIIINT